MMGAVPECRTLQDLLPKFFTDWKVIKMNLVKYDAARYALQQAVQVDEVKDIRDKAQAMAAYAKQAKDTELVQWATEIKVRAERRAGQMLADMPKNQGTILRGNTMQPREEIKTLEEIGISKNQSARWQKLAAVSDDQFEQAITAAKEVAGEVTTAAMLRIERANKPPAIKTVTPKDENPTTLEESSDEDEYSEIDAKNDQIAALQDIVSVGYMDATEEEKEYAASLISDLRKQVKILEEELNSTKAMRDSYMRTNSELMKQVKRLENDIKKLRG